MKKIIALLLVFLFIPNILALTITKDSNVYASGESIGIKIDSGVIVTKLYDVMVKNEKYKPWENILKEGDKIIKIDDVSIVNLKSVFEALKSAKEQASITFVRNNVVYNDTIKVITRENGVKTIGLLLKDGILGVGTLTYVLEDNSCGALGHQISSDTVSSGTLYGSSVNSINRSTDSKIGEKNVEIEDYKIGEVLKNTETGIFGNIIENKNKETYKIGFKESVHKGEAYILTTIDGKKIEKFSIEILDAYKQDKKSIKSMRIKVTDKRLIEKTGGIVQGMSGSPIIQDGLLVGALTHVIVENPTEGYGIYIEWMLEDNGVDVKK